MPRHTSCKQKRGWRGTKKELYLIPYRDASQTIMTLKKTLLHAIERQESLFIHGIVTSGYAIRVMQIIPILGEELGAKRKEKFDFFELFEPKKTYRMRRHTSSGLSQKYRTLP